MDIREQFRKKVQAELKRQRGEAKARGWEGHEQWRQERDLHRRGIAAMEPIMTAVREIARTTEINYKKHGHDAFTVEGLRIHVHLTQTKAIYMFGDRPNVKRYLTLDDALEALTDHLAEAVARRMPH
jgi:hypothetical protein